jgi:uncharacterized Zn-finger protein
MTRRLSGNASALFAHTSNSSKFFEEEFSLGLSSPVKPDSDLAASLFQNSSATQELSPTSSEPLPNHTTKYLLRDPKLSTEFILDPPQAPLQSHDYHREAHNNPSFSVSLSHSQQQQELTHSHSNTVIPSNNSSHHLPNPSIQLTVPISPALTHRSEYSANINHAVTNPYYSNYELIPLSSQASHVPPPPENHIYQMPSTMFMPSVDANIPEPRQTLFTPFNNHYDGGYGGHHDYTGGYEQSYEGPSASMLSAPSTNNSFPSMSSNSNNSGIPLAPLLKRKKKNGPAPTHVCPYETCGQKFQKLMNFKSHLKSHEMDKTFDCLSCGSVFRRAHDLKRHVTTLHTDVKPFACTVCPISFARIDALKRHVSRPGAACFIELPAGSAGMKKLHEIMAEEGGLAMAQNRAREMNGGVGVFSTNYEEALAEVYAMTEATSTRKTLI